jgi:integral membrane protein
MAYIVGVSIAVLILIGVPLKYLLPTGSRGNLWGQDITLYLGTVHGFLYMLFLLMAFDLARRCRWSLVFTALTLLFGTVPIVSFFAEHRATQHVRAQLADAAESQPGTASDVLGATPNDRGAQP